MNQKLFGQMRKKKSLKRYDSKTMVHISVIIKILIQINFYFMQIADCKFEFCVKDDSDSGLGGKWHEDDAEMIPWRKVLIFHASKLDDAIDKVTNLLQQ